MLLYTRTGQLPLIHVQVTPATIAAILEHGENCRDAVDVPLFGPPHPEDGGPGATMRVIRHPAAAAPAIVPGGMESGAKDEHGQ